MSGETSKTMPPCPDPSVHQHQHHQQTLSEQASTAALYATHPERGSNPLNPDGKLSSKSAAASLKYAETTVLASDAFLLKESIQAAQLGQAAMLAKDYKMKDLWHPELSAAGSKAALLAHKDGVKLDLWQPSASADGNSAAKLAMRNKNLSPQLDYGYTKDGHSNALLAATKSQRDNRKRAGSTPTITHPGYPDSANSAQNALNAATVSHRASSKVHSPMDPDGWDSPANQAARIQNIGHNLDPQMYTANPPVDIQERRDKDSHNSAVISMAKQMYQAQHRTVLGDAAGKGSAAASAPPDMKQEAMRYIHLQDAAHKLAQERLAKVDKNFEAMRYREYYGYNANPQRSRLSVSGFRRKRASSEANKDQLDSDDEEQARRVRNQMSQFSSALASVDAKKQQTDRDALMAVAQKRVTKSMADMDAKVFQDTGKVSQAMMDEWETKAKKRATDDAEKREVNRGKTHIGAGKYMDNSEIEAIAQARLKPTLDEISENAEKRRARDEEIRYEKEQQEYLKQQDKQRNKEGKEEWKKFKEQEKAVARKEKEERKDEPDTHRSLLSRLSGRQKHTSTKQEDSVSTAVIATPEKKKEVKPDVESTAVSSSAGVTAIATPEKKETIKPDIESTAVSSSAGVTAIATPDNKTKDEETADSTVVSSSAGVAAINTDLDTTKHEHRTEDDVDPSTQHDFSTKDETAADPVVILPPVKDEAGSPVVPLETVSSAEVPANAVRVPEGLSTVTTAQPSTAQTNAQPSTVQQPTTALTEDENKSKSQKGLKGLLSKLRSRKDDGHGSKSSAGPAAIVAEEQQQQHQKAETTSTPVVAGADTESSVQTDTAGETQRGIGGEQPISPSSFRRRDADGNDADVSDMSSGVDEDDFKQGRTGRAARASKRKEDGTGAEPKAQSELHHELDDEDEETFEEARDTVEPGTAAEPSFVGQRDATVHGRETKFQEEL